MWSLIRFGFAILSLVCVFAIWTPVILRGFWPYTENFMDFERIKTQQIEVTSMIWTGYWLFVSANIFIATYVLQASFNIRSILFGGLIDMFALTLVLSFHLTQMNRRKKLPNRTRSI